ncbi:MAG: hypothetical protein KKG92_10630 [Gammaproteobacteria bacterium]|nr:hypothetical protein [Gammaproteobacteria bacterium]
MALPEDLDSAGRRSLVARLDPGSGVKEGDTLNLCLDPARVQVFDAVSGENLTLTQRDGEV